MELTMDKIAIVRIRGIRNMKPDIKKTLELLRLSRPHHCVVMDASPQTMGMVKLAQDYLTFGKISESTLSSLLIKRGENGSKKASEVSKESELAAHAKSIIAGKKVGEFVDPVFRLHPPRKGYKNIKLHFPQGDLGERTNMDDLLKRMM